MAYRDRSDAGRLLAAKLAQYASRRDVQVLALAGPGVRVAYQTASALDAALDIFSVRTLELPNRADAQVGAVALGIRIVDDEAIRGFDVSRRVVDDLASNEQWKLERSDRACRGDRPAPSLRDRIVILVDDGEAACGPMLRAAARAIREHQPHRLIIALPIASLRTRDELEIDADEVVCGITMDSSRRVEPIEQWYAEDATTTEEDMRDLLDQASHGLTATAYK